MSLLHELRLAALGMTRSTGVMQMVARSRWRSNRLLILCYHGCSLRDEHEWNPRLYISPAVLRRRLEILRDGGYQVLSLDKGVQALYQGTLPQKSVVLTFDDGAVDFKARVVPLLEEFGYHATLYVSTYYVDRQLAVFDTMLSYLLWKARGSVVHTPGIAHVDSTLDLRTDDSRALAGHSILTLAKSAGESAQAKDELLEQLASALGIDYGELRASRLLHFMTRAELAALPSEHVSVQLHTHRHRVPRERALFHKELDENRAVLLETRPHGDPLVHFCYPSSVTHAEVPEFLLEAGVKSATTCEVALATRRDNPMLLPRYVDSSAFADLEFEGWLSGMSAWLPRRSGAAYFRFGPPG